MRHTPPGYQPSHATFLLCVPTPWHAKQPRPARRARPALRIAIRYRSRPLGSAQQHSAFALAPQQLQQHAQRVQTRTLAIRLYQPTLGPQNTHSRGATFKFMSTARPLLNDIGARPHIAAYTRREPLSTAASRSLPSSPRIHIALSSSRGPFDARAGAAAVHTDKRQIVPRDHMPTPVDQVHQSSLKRTSIFALNQMRTGSSG